MSFSRICILSLTHSSLLDQLRRSVNKGKWLTWICLKITGQNVYVFIIIYLFNRNPPSGCGYKVGFDQFVFTYVYDTDTVATESSDN